MKKSTILLITVLFMVIGYAAYNTTVNIYGLGKLSENISDFKVYLSNLKVNGAEISGINNAKDEFTISDINGDVTVDIINASTEYDTEAYLECDKDNTWTFDYTGGEQTFTAPIANSYKLEVWGAQGGSIDKNDFSVALIGGYGAYSVGNVELTKNAKFYINVGGSGKACLKYGTTTSGTKTCGDDGGYNGGGNTRQYTRNTYYGSGGGATHIATTSGLLETFSNDASKILLVAGGGGGATSYIPSRLIYAANGGNAGGYIGSVSETLVVDRNTVCTGGSQTTAGTGTDNNGSFGIGASLINYVGPGAGAGFYGGGTSEVRSCGGSGYIGNTLLSEKSMYCYNCTESSEVSTKTISTTCVNETATANCAKSGNGYARITLLSSPTNIETDKTTIIAQESTNQSIKSVVGKTLTCKLKLNKLSRTEKAYTGQREWSYDYTGAEQSFTAPVSGTYKFELWGAQGGVYNQTANGGYVSGELKLDENNKFYIYIGRYGRDSISNNYVFNYGYQNYVYTGGGATDIRLINGSWDNLTSLASRIMVAGGGGGAGGLNPDDGGSPYGGSAGGLSGYQGGSCISGNVTEHQGSTGATQTSGHAFGYVPLLNTGENYNYVYNNSGGNGYWSGNFYDWVGSGGHSAVPGAGGGSSFISGHAGCVAITSQDNTTPRNDSNGSTCQDGTTDITCSYHYSNIIFKNTIMVDGNGYNWTTVKGKQTQMPSHDGTTTVVGNSGNGYARITLISTD